MSASPQTIVVIGAGLAGLTAARDLKASGHSVIVLDGRDRIGGRIWTSRAWPDMPMDLGASWIHGIRGNPLTKLADEAGAKRLGTSYESSVLLNATGKELPARKQLDAAEDVVSAVRKAANKRDDDQSLAEAITSSKYWRQSSAAERRFLRHYINGTVEQEYGGDWSEVSTWFFDAAKDFPGGDELFPGGFDQIIQHLAKGLDIRLNRKVSALAPAKSGVTLSFADGASLSADRVVITVPLGVLKAGAIRFDEPLDKKRQKAIATLGMGLLNKCWLRFDEVAWPNDVDWIEWMGPKDGIWAQWVSLAQVAKLPVLLGFHAGHQAREMEKLSNRKMMASAHEALKAMFGASFPAPIAAQITRWSEDPFAFGSYSFNAVGSTRKTRTALAGGDWDGRLIFAGEAASADYYGTAHGAVLSGQAAAQLLEEL